MAVARIYNSRAATTPFFSGRGSACTQKTIYVSYKCIGNYVYQTKGIGINNWPINNIRSIIFVLVSYVAIYGANGGG